MVDCLNATVLVPVIYILINNKLDPKFKSGRLKALIFIPEWCVPQENGIKIAWCFFFLFSDLKEATLSDITTILVYKQLSLCFN